MAAYTTLGSLITPAETVRCGSGKYPVLSMTMYGGIVLQRERFKKSLASIDQSDYKVVRRGQLVVGFPIDEGVLSSMGCEYSPNLSGFFRIVFT